MKLEVGYGSIITLRHYLTKNSFLHSHSHLYPSGSKQQQITMYPHADGNNEWKVLDRRPPAPPLPKEGEEKAEDGGEPQEGKYEVDAEDTPPPRGDNAEQVQQNEEPKGEQEAKRPMQGPQYREDGLEGETARRLESLELLDEVDNGNIKVQPKEIPAYMQTFTPLRHMGVIRLEHVQTQRYLHSHVVAPPVSHKDHHFEVSGYGYAPENIGDTNDDWRIELVSSRGEPLNIEPLNKEIIDKENEEEEAEMKRLKEMNITLTSEESKARNDKRTQPLYPPIEARVSYVKIVHVNTGCYLSTFNKKLPTWGFEQGEATCGRDSLKKNAVWVIDTNRHHLCKPV